MRALCWDRAEEGAGVRRGVDAEDGGGLQRREEFARRDDFISDVEVAEKIALDAAGGAVGLKGCVLDGAVVGLVADDSHGWLWVGSWSV